MGYSGTSGKRYAPGKRRNSFYMNLPDPKGYEERMEVLDQLPGYIYHIDEEIQKLIREEII